MWVTSNKQNIFSSYNWSAEDQFAIFKVQWRRWNYVGERSPNSDRVQLEMKIVKVTLVIFVCLSKPLLQRKPITSPIHQLHTLFSRFSMLDRSKNFITNCHRVFMSPSFRQRKCTFFIQLGRTGEILDVRPLRMKKCYNDCWSYF